MNLLSSLKKKRKEKENPLLCRHSGMSAQKHLSHDRHTYRFARTRQNIGGDDSLKKIINDERKLLSLHN
jgi:hypothetical protein